MLHEIPDNPADGTTAELHEQYLAALIDVLSEYGIDAVAESSGIDSDRLETVRAGEDPELTLEEAASILAVSDESPDAETIAAVSRDELLMGMATAVLDVEAVESGIEGELEAREIQSKLEGRFPMTLREFALLHGYIKGAR